MSTEGWKTILLAVVLSVASIIWSSVFHRPYWTVLSACVLAWALREAYRGGVTNSTASLLCASLLACVPLASTLLGPPSGEVLEILLSPLLIYSLSLWTISSAFTEEDRSTSATRAFMTFMLAISIGTLALLTLYYLDAAFFSDLVPSNSALMWPLSSLLFGSLAISLTLRALGMEETVHGSREAEG